VAPEGIKVEAELEDNEIKEDKGEDVIN